MARFIRSIIGYNDPIEIPWRVAASQTINEGDLVGIDATSRYLKSAAASSTTLAGIAQQSITTSATVTPNDKITVLPLTDVVVRLNFTGSTKKTLADTDLATTKFNLKDPQTIDLDNTTNGMCTVIDYDNDLQWADVLIADASIAKIG